MTDRPEVLEELTDRTCPYCRTEDAARVGTNPETVRCTTCGLYRLLPRLTREGQRRFIRAYYGDVGPDRWGNPVVRSQDAEVQSEVRFARRAFPDGLQGVRVLEIGCAEGSFVAAMQQAGATASGLDPQEPLVTRGREHGLDLHHGTFDPAGLPAALAEQSFDLVCFRASICYMTDLQEAFAIAGRLLRPDGWLYVKDHLATSIYYRTHRDYSSRFKLSVAGMPTLPALEYLLREEGYRVEATEHPPADLYGLLGGPEAFRPLAAVGRKLGRHAYPLAVRAGFADYVRLLASRNAPACRDEGEAGLASIGRAAGNAQR